MNAQQTTSVVNLISAQPPASSSPASANSDSPRFADVLVRQQNDRQPQARQPVSATETVAKPAAAAGPETPANKVASADAQPSENAPASVAANPLEKASGATEEALPENATALAMSDLAAAVAQVFMARDAALAQKEPALAGAEEGAADKTSSLLARLSPQVARLEDTVLPDTQTIDAKTSSAVNVISSKALAGTTIPEAKLATEPNPVFATQVVPAAATAAGQTPRTTLDNLNQRAEALDREARLNAFTRDLIDGKAPAPNTADLESTLEADNFANDNVNNRLAPASAAGLMARDQVMRETAVLDSKTPPAEVAITGAVVSAPAAPGSIASPMISTPLGHPQWGNDFSQHVAGISQTLKNGLQSIEMRLDPPDLGPIRITLTLNDGVAQAAFVSPHANVRSAVENALPQLQQQLAQNGISLGQTSVSDQGQAQQEAANTNGSGAKANNSLASAAGVTENATPVQNMRSNTAHNGQINTFA